jgi:hypothetical protein
VGLIREGEEQVFLALDVVVEAALEDADPGGDVLDPGRGVALLVEDLAGRLEDLVPAGDVEGAPGRGAPGRACGRWGLGLGDHGANPIRPLRSCSRAVRPRKETLDLSN